MVPGYPGAEEVDVTGAGWLDRQVERAAIDDVLRSVRDGFSAALVIRGSTGVGKTALLRYAAHAAPDMRVCSVTGIETDVGLAFAALHELLVPVLPGVAELPDPQRHALQVAFGMETGPAADRFLVGLAALTLLARAAEQQPVLCLIDDRQWPDVESGSVLAFVARRLYADQVGMVVAVAEPVPARAFEPLREVSVGGLPAEEATQLLRSVAGLSAACKDPDPSAWHRGEAATGPDEDVAAALELAASRAQARGGDTDRVALLRRSVELTPDNGQRAHRELALADAELRSGYPDIARDLVYAALPDLPDPRSRALGEQLRGEILFVQGRVADSASALAGAARLLAPDHAAAREAMAVAMRAAIWAGPIESKEIATAAAELPRPAGPEARVCDLLLEGFAARFTVGYSAAIQPFRAALSVLRSDDPGPATELRWYGMGVIAALSIWDVDSVLDITSRFLRAARARGALAALPRALALRATADCPPAGWPMPRTGGQKCERSSQPAAALPSSASTA